MNFTTRSRQAHKNRQRRRTALGTRVAVNLRYIACLPRLLLQLNQCVEAAADGGQIGPQVPQPASQRSTLRPRSVFSRRRVRVLRVGRRTCRCGFLLHRLGLYLSVPLSAMHSAYTALRGVEKQLSFYLCLSKFSVATRPRRVSRIWIQDLQCQDQDRVN